MEVGIITSMTNLVVSRFGMTGTSIELSAIIAVFMTMVAMVIMSSVALAGREVMAGMEERGDVSERRPVQS